MLISNIQVSFLAGKLERGEELPSRVDALLLERFNTSFTDQGVVQRDELNR